jgi:hypothetical protein
MLVKEPGKLIFKDEDTTEEKLSKVSSVVNVNSEDMHSVVKSLDFDNNFKGITKSDTFLHNDVTTIYHKLNQKVKGWFISKGSKIERLIEFSSDRTKIEFTAYLKSTYVRVAGAATTTIDVYNPYIFDVSDDILVGSNEVSIKEIDVESRQIEVDTVITYSLGDSVTLVRSNETLFIF